MRSALFSALVLCCSAASAASRIATADSCSVVSSPAPCGQSYDTEAQCVQRGCCYNAAFANLSQSTPCFYPGADAVPIKYVHIIQACHFDAGFADSTVGIFNRWWYQHFPQAWALGNELSGPNASLGLGLRFMAQSYIVSMFFDCPPNIPGLPCPSAELVANVTAAIERGYITWHAFPYNGEAELMTPSTFAAGVALTHALDLRFGQAPKATLSQRDVPGTTRSLIPILLANNVTALSEGVNDASAYALVPRMFMWRDATSGASIPYLYHPHGYGGISWEDVVVVPGSEHAFVPNWRGDNAGPPQSVGEVLGNFQDIQKLFPGAQLFASTFDNFTSSLTPDVLGLLPVIEDEIGDTWIHGSASDPWKSAWFRRGQLALEACLAPGGGCDPADPNLLNATRHLLKNGEHTWGKDIKTFLHDQVNWTNEQLNAAVAANLSNFVGTMASWDEQRYFGIELALAALPAGHPLLAPLQQAWADIHPTAAPSTSGGWSPAVLGPAGIQAAGNWRAGLDAKTGALGYLFDSAAGVEWANASTTSGGGGGGGGGGGADAAAAPPCILGLVHYQTYTGEDYTNFMDNYCSYGSNPPSWFLLDFGKPNVSSASPAHYEVDQSAVAAFRAVGGGPGSAPGMVSLSYLVQSRLTPDGTDVLHTYYGAPADIWTRYDFPSAANPNQSVNASIVLLQKTATRLPESLFLRFNPSSAIGASTAPGQASQAWWAGKMGAWVNASDVAAHGNQRHHGVSSGVKYVKTDGAGAAGGAGAASTATLTVTSNEAALACFGHPTGFPTPSAASLAPFDPSDGEGFSFFVLGQIWGTNYPAWIPWTAEDVGLAYSFSLTPGTA